MRDSMRLAAVGLALLCVPAAAAGQEMRSMAGPASLEVRSTNAEWRVLHVDIRAKGGTLTGMAVIGGAPGTVLQDATGGHATTPVMVNAGRAPGSIRLEVSTNEPLMRAVVRDSAEQVLFVAIGRVITAVRDSTGRLTVSAPQIRAP